MQKLSSFFLPRRRDSLDGSWKKVETCIPFGWGEGGLNFCSLAHLAPTWEVPGVGEAATLLGFDGLDFAILTVEEDAGTVGLINQGEAAAVGAKAGVGSDELGFLNFQK